MAEINPAADALKHIDPNSGILQNVGTAKIIKLFNSEFLNLLASGNAKLFFGRHFGRKAVTVPAKATLDFFTVHGLKAGDHVLNIRDHYMAVVRRAVGKRRAVIEYELGGTVTITYGFFKSLVFFPKSENFFFNFNEVRLSLNVCIMFRHQ